MPNTKEGIIVHCSATYEGQNVRLSTVKGWHTWPKDFFNKNKEYLFTRYLGKKYYGRDELPENVRDKHGRGFIDVGYHYYFNIDGSMEVGRPLNWSGAHCHGKNTTHIGVCYAGGLDLNGNSKDTRTESQKERMVSWFHYLTRSYPTIKEIVGHNKYANKDCPCFDAEAEYKHLLR